MSEMCNDKLNLASWLKIFWTLLHIYICNMQWMSGKRPGKYQFFSLFFFSMFQIPCWLIFIVFYAHECNIRQIPWCKFFKFGILVQKCLKLKWFWWLQCFLASEHDISRLLQGNICIFGTNYYLKLKKLIRFWWSVFKVQGYFVQINSLWAITQSFTSNIFPSF